MLPAPLRLFSAQLLQISKLSGCQLSPAVALEQGRLTPQLTVSLAGEEKGIPPMRASRASLSWAGYHLQQTRVPVSQSTEPRKVPTNHHHHTI